MKVLVTGKQGQLVQSLLERASHFPEVVLISVGRPELDLAAPDTIASAIANAAPDLVINAAAYTAVDQAEDEPDAAFRINAAAAGEVAAAARAAGARLIQLSTDYVFDGRSDAPYAEEAATGPTGVYGRSKLEGERLVLAAHPQAAIVRTAWVYSPFGKNFVRTMLALAETRDALSVVADQHGNPSSALDIADGLLTMAQSWARGGDTGSGETYHLAGTGRASWFDLAEAVFADSCAGGGPFASVNPIATSDYPTRAARPANSELDCARLECDFGYRMPPWRASVTPVVGRLLDEKATDGARP